MCGLCVGGFCVGARVCVGSIVSVCVRLCGVYVWEVCVWVRVCVCVCVCKECCVYVCVCVCI